MKKASVKMFLVVMALVLALCSSALAESKTATVFGEMYGDEFKATIENGTLIESGESVELGDIVYTLEEIVFADGTFRFTFEISNEEGSLERQDSYELNLYIRNAVMDANDTLINREQWETTDWVLTVTPQIEE